MNDQCWSAKNTVSPILCWGNTLTGFITPSPTCTVIQTPQLDNIATKPSVKRMAEATYRALLPVRYLQILILFTKTTDSEDSWKKNKNPRQEEKKKTRLKRVHILYVVKIIWNRSFDHAAEASHHSLIPFIPSKNKRRKKRKSKQTWCECVQYQVLVLEGDGERWEPLQNWSHWFRSLGSPVWRAGKEGGSSGNTDS